MTKKNKLMVRHYYVNYKKKAKARGIYFDLTFTQFYQIVTSHCYFCGVAPCTKINKYVNKQGQKTVAGKTLGQTLRALKEYDTYLNGVDRFENTQPYTVSNCVPCCKLCNRGKGDADLDSFYLWLYNIVEYNMDWYLEKNKETKEDYED